MEVVLEDAASLWGKDTEQTTEAVDKGAGSLVIGPALTVASQGLPTAAHVKRAARAASQ